MKIRSGYWLAVVLAFILAGCNAEQAVVSDSAVPAADPYRLADDVRPVMQLLHLNIDPNLADYSGSTTITIEIGSERSSFRLHAKEMQIDDLSLSAGGNAVDVTYEEGEHGLLTVTAGEVLAAGNYELQIDFSNDFQTDGVGINRTENGGAHYIFSQFEAIDARLAFPCFDEPGFKFPWQLTMTVPESVMAITNTPEVSVTRENGQVTTVFDSTPPLPSYLIAVAVGPFETVAIDGMSVPGRVIVPQGKSELAAFAVETTPPLLAYLEDYFGEPYPFKKLDLIATFQSFSGAMEHPGAITYSDFYLLLDETASASEKAVLIKITAHELAHQWFGNLVTMQWWDDLWLNESFADWMGDKTAEAVYGEFGRGIDELRTTFRVMDIDLRSSTKPIRHHFKSTDNFSDGVFLSYYKGKSVLGMFEDAVGADVFREGVVRYLRKYSRGNAEASDLWAAINAGAEMDLAGGLASFIDQPGIPLVTVKSLGNGEFEFSQSRLSSDTSASQQSWILPVSFSYLAADGLRTDSVLLDRKSAVVELGNDVEWILPNGNSRGYYRWTVPVDMLTQLGADAAEHLNVRERMEFLSNLWALLATDHIDGDDFLASIRAVSTDTDASVISALIDQIDNIEETFITPDLRDSFAVFVNAVLSPVLDRIGTDPIPGENPALASLRPQVLLRAAHYGRNETAQEVTADYTQRYLAGEIPASEHVSVAMRTQARIGDLELFEQYREAFEAATSPNDRRRYSMAIGSFRDPDVVAEVLNYSLEGPLQTIELTEVVRRLTGAEDNHQQLLEWAMANDANLRERLPEGSMVRIPDALTRCSTEHLPVLLEFYGAPERAVSGIESELKDAEAEVLECAAFRQREIESVRRYLSEGV
jgi:alanyl aminopeptidase